MTTNETRPCEDCDGTTAIWRGRTVVVHEGFACPGDFLDYLLYGDSFTHIKRNPLAISTESPLQAASRAVTEQQDQT